MKKVELKISENKKISKDVYRLVLEGNVDSIKGSGQFAELALDKYYLRRPLSIHDYNQNSVTFLYKVLGQGTKDLTTYEEGKVLDVLIGLGRGFDLSKSKKPLLIGGGIGIAPLYHLAKEFSERGIKPLILLGFKNQEEVIYEKEFSMYGEVYITTDDGTKGFKGNAISFLKEKGIDYDYYYACGPQIMLHYLKEYNSHGEVSLEARMGCGIGACMGCSIETKTGPQRVCKEGPVFEASEVLI